MGGMAESKCAFCKSELLSKDARCRACGWALHYDPEARRRARLEALGVSLSTVVVAAIVLAIVYFELLP